MVSLDLDKIAPIFIALGFGILFMGMGVMSSSLNPITQSDAFRNVIYIIGNNRFLGVLAGLGMTAIVQSSSATTGILVALATTGSIDMNVALPIILGCNIGTCVTALLASAGANRTAKKAALIHLFFNVIGVVIFIPFMTPLISLIESIDPGNVARQVANAHTIFNISVTIVLLPLAKYLVLLANKLLPGDEIIEKRWCYLFR